MNGFLSIIFDKNNWFAVVIVKVDKLRNTAVESELLVVINVAKDLEACPVTETSEDNEGRNTMCRVSIDLSSYTPLHDVEVNVQSAKPLVVSNDYYVFPNLCEYFQTPLIVIDPIRKFVYFEYIIERHFSLQQFRFICR